MSARLSMSQLLLNCLRSDTIRIFTMELDTEAVSDPARRSIKRISCTLNICLLSLFGSQYPNVPFMKNEQKAPRITRGASLYSTSILLIRQRSNTSSLLSSQRSPACQFASSASGAASSHRCNNTRSDTLKLRSAFTSPAI